MLANSGLYTIQLKQSNISINLLLHFCPLSVFPFSYGVVTINTTGVSLSLVVKCYTMFTIFANIFSLMFGAGQVV